MQFLVEFVHANDIKLFHQCKKAVLEKINFVFNHRLITIFKYEFDHNNLNFFKKTLSLNKFRETP